MLTTAAVLMSLGMEQGNARPAPSGQGDMAGVPFAESFGKDAALAGAMQTPGIDGTMLKDAVGSKAIVSAKNVNVPVAAVESAKVKASDGGKMQSKLGGANGLLLPENAKATGTASDGARRTVVPKQAPSQDGKSDGNASGVAQVEVQADRLSLGSVKDVVQKLPPGKVESTTTDTAVGMVVPQTDVATLEVLSLPDKGAKPTIQGQREMGTSDKNLEVASTQKVSKKHESSLKTERTQKAAKTEKAIGPTEDAKGIEGQIVITIPVITLSVDGQPNQTTAGRSVGLKMGTDSKNDRKITGTGKPGGNDVKAAAFALADDPASDKSGDDAAKITPATTTTAGESGKTQGGVAPGTIAAPLHATDAVSGAVSGMMPGVAVMHVAVVAPQTMGVSAHAAAIQSGVGMQSGSGSNDAAGPINTTYRTLMATPTALEVGVANGTHGWLKIRAEMTEGGAVNASLSTTSSSGQELLHRELPSLTAYLHSERVVVNTVVVQQTAASGSDFRGLTGGMNGDGRGQAQQSGSQGGENRQNTAGSVMNHTERDVPYNGLSGTDGGEPLPRASYVGGGSWLSVRA
ncbi:MAG: hypothetical protein ABI380_07260 [Edaphobacter sp.]